MIPRIQENSKTLLSLGKSPHWITMNHIPKNKWSKATNSTEFSPDSRNQDARGQEVAMKNSMKTTSKSRPANSTSDKRVFKKSPSNRRLTESQKRSWRQRETLSTTPPANSFTPSPTPKPTWVDTKALARNHNKNENPSILATIPTTKTVSPTTTTIREKAWTCQEIYKDYKLESICTRRQWEWKRKNSQFL